MTTADIITLIATIACSLALFAMAVVLALCYNVCRRLNALERMSNKEVPCMACGSTSGMYLKDGHYYCRVCNKPMCGTSDDNSDKRKEPKQQ